MFIFVAYGVGNVGSSRINLRRWDVDVDIKCSEYYDKVIFIKMVHVKVLLCLHSFIGRNCRR